ncbi:MAG: hypothetical protein RLZZ552_736 [Verrucomicrobiota bacterium]
MSLRRTAQIAVVLGLAAVGVWVVRGKKWELLRRPTPAVAATPAIKPRSAADIIPQLETPAKRKGVTIKDILEGKVPQLSQAEVDAFLQSEGRSPRNLLAAARILKDLKYAREAAILDPKDPLPQLELAVRGETPEERAAAITAFRAAAPDNSLGDYLAAHQAFASGDAGAAGAALLKSLDNPAYADYSQQVIDASAQAYVAAGYDPQAAMVSAMFSFTVEHIRPVVGVSDSLKALQDEFVRIADFDAAEPTVVIGLSLGQRIQDQGSYLIDQLSGIAIERKFLNALDPATQAGPGGQTAGERIATLDAKLLEIKDLTSRFTPAFASADETKQSQYLAKMKAEGELAAMRWLLEGK